MATTILDDRVKSCSDARAECVEACEACARHCIEMAPAEMVQCVKLCLDVAVLCAACLPLLARSSPFWPQLCGLCAEAYEACASAGVREVRRRRDAPVCRGVPAGR